METNPGWLELLLAGTNFHGPKPVQVTEVLLYCIYFFRKKKKSVSM